MFPFESMEISPLGKLLVSRLPMLYSKLYAVPSVVNENIVPTAPLPPSFVVPHIEFYL